MAGKGGAYLLLVTFGQMQPAAMNWPRAFAAYAPVRATPTLSYAGDDGRAYGGRAPALNLQAGSFVAGR
jgi:hypothetical protein